MSKKTLEHPNTAYFSDARARRSVCSVLYPCSYICSRQLKRLLMKAENYVHW